MNLTTRQVFPGLENLIPEKRFQRVDRAVQALFTRTLIYLENGRPFIITGDIPAMWLRDSTWQVKPLLKSKHPEVINLLVNLSRTQVQLFLIDPYANSFNPEPNGKCWHKDFSDQSPWVFERKYELDSWAALLYLARKIFEVYGVTEHLDANYQNALDAMLKLAKKEQNHDPESYIFKRSNGVEHDSLSKDGRGNPTNFTGMIYSAFRPSDDACKFGYLLPANLFFLNEIRNLPLTHSRTRFEVLAKEIDSGINTFGIVNGIYAYEVDGFGNNLLIDDANVPSLLSLPFLEVCKIDDPKYQATREFILSEQNPYYFSGSKAFGIGSQHTPENYVWPISIAMSAMTSADSKLQLAALEILESNDAGTGYMHESFDVNDDSSFTREWFSWSDMTYVDLVLMASDFNI